MTLLVFNSFAQRDSLQTEILNYSDTNSEMITKGRVLLADKFKEGDYNKVREIKDYLMERFRGKNYVVFYQSEYWHILYWTQQYDELLEKIKAFDSQNTNYKRRINPRPDFLFETLRDKSWDSQLLLDSMIKNAALKSVDKDFLMMYLKYIARNEIYQLEVKDSMNIIADNFLTSYPNSDYERFTRNYIRYKFVPSKWGFGIEFFSGYSIFTKDLKKNYQNTIPVGIAFDIYYRKMALYLRNFIGFSKTKNDIPYDDQTWEKGAPVRVFLPEATLGYVVLDNKRFKATPFAGISSTDISPTQHDLNKTLGLEKVDLKFTTTYTAGLNLDIKLGRGMPMVTLGPEENYGFLRFRYAINFPQFEKKYGYSGNLHYLTVGVGGFGKRIKREY